MSGLTSDGWPIGEKRQHCANCAKTRGKDCNRKKRVGIGYCRDWKAPVAETQPVGEQFALKGNNNTEVKQA